MLVEEIRKSFPGLAGTVYSRPLVYFDNAATAMRPIRVISKLEDLSYNHNANIHRAVHRLSAEATEEYENTRDYVQKYLNARSREEIVFTSGTTAAVNLAAFCFGESFIRPGDEILVSEAEHHSNLVPWQMMCERKGAVLKKLPIEDDGTVSLDVLVRMLTPATKLFCVAHITNTLGIENPLKDIVNICHSKNCPVFADGAQGIVHSRTDVQETGVDFYAFSGHKVYAATGTGVLYGRKELLEKMPPYMGGGEMVGTVKFTGTTYAPLPGKFEAGTQNINAIPTLVPALEIAEAMRDTELEKYCEGVSEYIFDALTSNPRIRLFGVPRGAQKKAPIFSFVVDGVHHEDIALILDKMGIAVRSGQMCAEPVMDRFGVTGMVRASLAPYNTMEEAESFIRALERAIKMLS